MKRLRDLDDYERETLYRLICIVLAFVVVVVLAYVASTLPPSPSEQPEPLNPHMSPLPYVLGKRSLIV